MKPRIKTGILILLAIALAIVGRGEYGIPNATATSIATVDGRVLPVSSFPKVFKECLRTIRTNGNYDNFILFIHGRGKHPEKALKNDMLANLESDYSAKVVMFHWPSWQGPLAFPEEQARSSANDFIKILREIERIKKSQPDTLRHIRFTLLTHSMGSLVLEQSVLNLGSASPQWPFDTVLICASASSARDHALWVNRMILSRNVYITVNRFDTMLGSAGVLEMSRRLGMGLTSQGQAVPLATNTHYIDVSAIGPLHHYFLHNQLERAPATRQFMDQVLNGLPATLPADEPGQETPAKQVYVLDD